MASRYYSVPIGGSQPQAVTESASASPAAFVDVRVTYDATGNSKFAAMKAVESVVMYLMQKNWPPV